MDGSSGTQLVPDQMTVSEHWMQASRLYGPRDLRLEDVSRPQAGPGDVLLRVRSVGICGSDVHRYQQGHIVPADSNAPLILGHEFSAEVAGIGAAVDHLEIGQLVAVDPAIPCGHCEICELGHPNLCPNVLFCSMPPTDGALAEYAVMPAANCFPLPPDISPAEGALLEPLGIALHAVNLAHLHPGYTVAVLGAGPIGLLISMVARLSGASDVYVSEPLPYRRNLAMDHGADVAVDPSAQCGTINRDIVDEILDLTGRRGVDVAFEAAGAAETPDQAAALTRPGGTVIVAGIPVDDTMTMTASTVRRKGLSIKLVRRMKHMYPTAIHLVEKGLVDVRPLITHRFPLEHVADAFELATSYEDGVMRAIVEV